MGSLDFRVIEIFKEISRVPRESGNEKGISDYIVNFAIKHKLEYTQDSSYNVVIKKAASQGYENEPPFVLQSHIDMVCVKTESSGHDFNKDPIEIITEGDYIKANDTSLGADNGIGVSMMLAILEDNSLSCPKLECIFTVEEETTMNGAKTIDTSIIEGKRLLGLDHTTEGEILVSSAGMLVLNITENIEYEDFNNDNYLAYELNVSGLLGGHSGDAIHLDRGNAICILINILEQMIKEHDIKVLNISAGIKDNVIPSSAETVILINKEKLEHIENEVREYEKDIQHRYPNEKVEISLKETTCYDAIIKKEIVNKIIEFLNKSPNAVYTMSDKIEGLTESSNNIGTISIKDNKLTIGISIRSSVKSLDLEIYNKIKELSDSIGLQLKVISEAPMMEYRVESDLRDTSIRVYKDMYNEELKPIAIHAGVEAGVFASKIQDLDIALISPNLYDIHTTNERASISSIIKVYNFLVEVLKQK